MYISLYIFCTITNPWVQNSKKYIFITLFSQMMNEYCTLFQNKTKKTVKIYFNVKNGAQIPCQAEAWVSLGGGFFGRPWDCLKMDIVQHFLH